MRRQDRASLQQRNDDVRAPARDSGWQQCNPLTIANSGTYSASNMMVSYSTVMGCTAKTVSWQDCHLTTVAAAKCHHRLVSLSSSLADETTVRVRSLTLNGSSQQRCVRLCAGVEYVTQYTFRRVSLFILRLPFLLRTTLLQSDIASAIARCIAQHQKQLTMSDFNTPSQRRVTIFNTCW